MMERWLPLNAAAHGAQIDGALNWVHWLMALLFVGWMAFFFFVLWRFRRAKNPVANHTGVTSHATSWLEGAVALAEAILLIGLSIPLWADRVEKFPPEQNAVKVRLVGEQFAWNIHYPGPDGKFGKTDIALVSADNPIGLDRRDAAAKDDITTINQLNLPVDRPVLVHLSSKDVIHSFGLFEMRVKQDAVPGLDIPVWFVPTRIGDYEIACSQLCGLGHYRMRGFVNIKSAADFQTFLTDEAKGIPK
jgi:cytochrome c oxidase subunit 2